MRRFIKSICLVLLCVLLFGLYGCTDGKDDGKGEEMEEKQTLLFQVDPGLGGKGLTTLFKADDPYYMTCLNNVIEGLKPLQEKFEVAVLINPQHSYDAKSADAGRRIAEGLKVALKTFGEAGIKAVLEIYSSDTGTNQNGELASLKKPNLFYGDGKETAGITMDMNTLENLKLLYPDTLLGVRMHELVGTHEIAMRGNPHGFLVTENTIKAIIDTCKNSGMSLFWSDHSWDGIGDPDYFENSFFTECIEYAEAQLKSRLTLIWANNNWEVCDYIGNEEKTFPFKNYRSAKFGHSNQSWIWESYGSSNLTQTVDGQTTTKWFAHSEMDTPVEVLASYTLDFLRQGASVIQYEPDYYFFNFHNIPWLVREKDTNAKDEGVRGFYEEKPDFSARLNLKRLTQYLLHPEADNAPPDRISDFVDGNRATYLANKATDPYLKYTQAMIASISGNSAQVFDRYIYDPTEFKENSEARFTAEALSGEIVFSSRINAWAKTVDDFLLVKREAGKNVGYIYTAYNGLIKRETQAFSDDGRGTVVGVTCANLVNKRMNSLGGDPDELIVARKKDGQIGFTVYMAKENSRSKYYDFDYVEVENARAILTDVLGVSSVSADGFIGLSGLGLRRCVLLDSGLRPLDALVLLKSDNGGVNVRTKIGGAALSKTFNFGGEVTAFAPVDITIDVASQKLGYKDELCLSLSGGGENKLVFLSFDGGNISLLSDEIKLSQKCDNLITVRYGLYYRDK